jgi:hypothetical protein
MPLRFVGQPFSEDAQIGRVLRDARGDDELRVFDPPRRPGAEVHSGELHVGDTRRGSALTASGRSQS